MLTNVSILTHHSLKVTAFFYLLHGDVAMLLLFAAIGRSIHTGGVSLDLQVLQTAAPFIGAWLLLAPFLGAYTPDATRSTGEAVKTVILSWVVSVPMGLVGRGVIKGDVPPVPFMAVTMTTRLAGKMSALSYQVSSRLASIRIL